MENSSLRPILDLEIPGLAVKAWAEVVRHALARAREIEMQRLNYRKITDQYHDDWRLLHRFEYNHYYSAWVAVAFRLRACAIHSQDFTDAFQRTSGTSQAIELYQEDDALFDFFVKGLAALESFYYSLYALGALIFTPTQMPSVPPSAEFPLLDPAHLLDPTQPDSMRNIAAAKTHLRFTQVFPGLPLTELLGRILGDEMYKEWNQIRNVLAHRAASAGRTIQYQGPLFFQSGEPPLSVRQWVSDLPLDAATTTSRYDWLRETINSGLEETSAFAVQQLAYTEDQLSRFV